jgi:hypothetical protein
LHFHACGHDCERTCTYTPVKLLAEKAQLQNHLSAITLRAESGLINCVSILRDTSQRKKLGWKTDKEF